jgi:hypothetical protein
MRISNVSDDEDSDFVSEELVCQYKSDVIPAVETICRKSWTSSRRRPRGRRTILKFLVGLMMLVQRTDSFADAICCDITRNFCERWMMPLSVCIERAARGDPFVLGKGKDKGRVRTAAVFVSVNFDGDNVCVTSRNKRIITASIPANDPYRARVDGTQEGISPDHHDFGGGDLSDDYEYRVDEFPRRSSENPANDNHSAKRRDNDGEPLSDKRLRNDRLNSIAVHQRINLSLEYSSLKSLDVLDLYNRSGCSNVEVATGKIAGQRSVQEDNPYKGEPRANAEDNPVVYAACATAVSRGWLKVLS